MRSFMHEHTKGCDFTIFLALAAMKQIYTISTCSSIKLDESRFLWAIFASSHLRCTWTAELSHSHTCMDQHNPVGVVQVRGGWRGHSRYRNFEMQNRKGELKCKIEKKILARRHLSTSITDKI